MSIEEFAQSSLMRDFSKFLDLKAEAIPHVKGETVVLKTRIFNHPRFVSQTTKTQHRFYININPLPTSIPSISKTT